LKDDSGPGILLQLLGWTTMKAPSSLVSVTRFDLAGRKGGIVGSCSGEGLKETIAGRWISRDSRELAAAAAYAKDLVRVAPNNAQARALLDSLQGQ